MGLWMASGFHACGSRRVMRTLTGPSVHSQAGHRITGQATNIDARMS